MAGMLYLVPTPIGNLGDISIRCRQTLEEADFIAAEDTRVTLKLLNHLGIKRSGKAVRRRRHSRLCHPRPLCRHHCPQHFRPVHRAVLL